MQSRKYRYRHRSDWCLDWLMSHPNPEANPISARASGGVFATTHWSMVLAAGHSSVPGAQEALETLCRTYWYPLYVYVRGQGNSPHDAQLIKGLKAALPRTDNSGMHRSFEEG